LNRSGLTRERVVVHPFAGTRVVITLADLRRFLVVLSRVDVHHLERQQIITLIVAIVLGRAGGELGVEKVVEGLPLLFEGRP